MPNGNLRFSKSKDILKKLFKKSKKPISKTVPNAKCPNCKRPVFYYQNELGSKVYFENLGKPWPIHYCHKKYISSPISRNKEIVIAHHMPGDRVELISQEKINSEYIQINLRFLTEGRKINKLYVIKHYDYIKGMLFVVETDTGQCLNGFYNKEFEYELWPISEFRSSNKNLFLHQIGDIVEITIDSNLQEGTRIQIAEINSNCKAYIYRGDLKKETKDRLKNETKVVILAQSYLNKENEIIFKEK
ncbi:MAG: hypothetical protein JNJ58_12120 [Chitinophagaceae bacterium]|nr:hypothetical protein [Chitinophagaceae bacterium]